MKDGMMYEREISQELLFKAIKKYVLYAMGHDVVHPMVALVSLRDIQLRMLEDLAETHNVQFADADRAYLLKHCIGESSPICLAGSLARLVTVVPASGASPCAITTPVAAGAATYAVGKVGLHYLAASQSCADLDAAVLHDLYTAWYREGESLAADLVHELGDALPRGETSLHLSPHSFTSRYIMRHPCLDDLPALCHLEAECWPVGLRAARQEIGRRIDRFPTGHCVLVIDDRVVGVIYSQRIQDAARLHTATVADVESLHTPHGPVVQLLALNVLPVMQHLGLGDQLLEFMLLRCAHALHLQHVVAVTRCKDYPKYAALPAADYIRARNPQGQLLDPILRFHAYHGAEIRGPIAGYRPEDRDNQGDGVLIAYDLPNRRARRGQLERRAEAFRMSILEEALHTLLGEDVELSPTRPLMDMGLDSLALYSLRTLLQQRLGGDLEPTFFFQHSTLEAIAAYFTDTTQAGEPTRTPPAPRPTPVRHRDAPRGQRRLPEDALAIIGMSCRFPHGANSTEDYWRLLRDGADAITEVPPTRWDIDQYYAADRHQPGKMVSRYGGFLDAVDRFDARFFHMAPREAAHTDPQHRLLLELTWEALEHAGRAPDSLQATQTGVFVGLFAHDYELLQVKQHGTAALDTYFATGNAVSVAAGRIAYVFGFEGPAMTVDTACSSSLVAVHLACRSLRQGECDLAIAAGVNLLLSPELSITFSRAGMLSEDGRCRTFDA